MRTNIIKIGSFKDYPPPHNTSLLIADPVYQDQDMVDDVVALAVFRKLPACVFMSIENLLNVEHKPDQICFWVKTPSTKNTVKRYSNFVEVIACYGVQFYEELRWDNRTGIFYDTVIGGDEFIWKKPDSLIEKLVRNHYPLHGVVYDPCCGSGTTHRVCKRLGYPSYCVELMADRLANVGA